MGKHCPGCTCYGYGYGCPRPSKLTSAIAKILVREHPNTKHAEPAKRTDFPLCG